jgi:multimeric flavodoxin WrbA
MSNTEILVKEALMGAQETGAEVELVRLNDLTIKPCTGCNHCLDDMFDKGGVGDCILRNDDFPFIDDKIMECDAMVVGAPIYEKTPPGLLKTLNDRMGPSHDMAFRIMAQKLQDEGKVPKGKGFDPRFFKTRVASLISVGGSEWDTLALPLLHLFALPMQMVVVDKVLFNWVGLPGVVALDDAKLARAHESGRHVGESLKRPAEEATYIGDEGICPICHSKVVEIREEDKNYPAICAICGVRGTLDVTAGKVTFAISDADRPLSHVTLSGKYAHLDELLNVSLKPPANIGELPARLEKYKGKPPYSKPDRP